ncbi:MAG: hypothetical protein ROO76_03690 [Terriglobia bacterium]|jgi:hypothetical protein|nr:hypothetical protein [Terriglobia bacterium]
MKRTLLCLTLLVAVTTIHAQSPSALSSISIIADKSEVPSNADVYIKITMTNTSNQDENCTSVYKDGVNKSYQYYVAHASMPINEEGRLAV